MEKGGLDKLRPGVKNLALGFDLHKVAKYKCHEIAGTACAKEQTRGTYAQAHEKKLLECGTQLSVQLPASPEGLPGCDQVGR